MAAPPTILASSRLTYTFTRPRQVGVAALSKSKQLDRQTAHAQMRVQYRRSLPVTQVDFYNQSRQAPGQAKK